MRSVLLILVFLFAVGCATSTPYQEANYLGYGYRSTRLDESNARVSFKGNKLTERADVELMLFYRAAELTLESGMSFFQFTRMETDRQTEEEPRAAQVDYYRTRRNGQVRLRNTGELGRPPFGSITFNKFEATSLINMSRTKLDDSYYNAQQIIKNLDPQIKRNQ